MVGRGTMVTLFLSFLHVYQKMVSERQKRRKSSAKNGFNGGPGWIRTSEVRDNRFTVYPV